MPPRRCERQQLRRRDRLQRDARSPYCSVVQEANLLLALPDTLNATGHCLDSLWAVCYVGFIAILAAGRRNNSQGVIQMRNKALVLALFFGLLPLICRA